MKSCLWLYLTMSVLFFLFCICAGCTDQNLNKPTTQVPGPSIAEIEGCATDQETIVVTDSTGRRVVVPKNVSNIVCSGPGCMRYLTYLQAEEMAVGSDGFEISDKNSEIIPYYHANPELHNLPVFTDSLGFEDPDKINNLEPAPEVIFKVPTSEDYNADELQEKTGIPVIVLKQGNLTYGRDDFEYSLRTMGFVINRMERAEKVIKFFGGLIENLENRTMTISDSAEKCGYVGGISSNDGGYLMSTTSDYPPFVLTKVCNIADTGTSPNDLAERQITSIELISSNPDAIFIEFTGMSDKNGIIGDYEGLYSDMDEISERKAYYLLPYRTYGFNHGSVLANAYFIGKVIYPDRFTDVNPKQIADYIYSFLYGRPLYDELNNPTSNSIFTQI